MLADDSALRTLHAVWIEAVNAGDLPRLLSWISDDVVFLNPGQPPFGRDAFSSHFTRAHQQFRICCTSVLEEIVVAGTVAYARSRDTLSVIPRTGGATTQLAGHRLTLYRQQPDGRWLLARDAHTLSPVPL